MNLVFWKSFWWWFALNLILSPRWLFAHGMICQSEHPSSLTKYATLYGLNILKCSSLFLNPNSWPSDWMKARAQNALFPFLCGSEGIHKQQTKLWVVSFRPSEHYVLCSNTILLHFMCARKNSKWYLFGKVHLCTLFD